MSTHLAGFLPCPPPLPPLPVPTLFFFLNMSAREIFKNSNLLAMTVFWLKASRALDSSRDELQLLGLVQEALPGSWPHEPVTFLLHFQSYWRTLGFLCHTSVSLVTVLLSPCEMTLPLISLSFQFLLIIQFFFVVVFFPRGVGGREKFIPGLSKENWWLILKNPEVHPSVFPKVSLPTDTSM